MKFKTAILTMALITSMTIFSGCGSSSDISSSDESSKSIAAETEMAKETPSLTEDEACSRAEDAIQDKFNSITPNLSDRYDVFTSWGGIVGSPEMSYDKNSDSYTATYSDGSCGIRYNSMGVQLVGGYKATFTATVKIYSNGDAHVDTFNYKVVKNK